MLDFLFLFLEWLIRSEAVRFGYIVSCQGVLKNPRKNRVFTLLKKVYIMIKFEKIAWLPKSWYENIKNSPKLITFINEEANMKILAII